jgi:hypothetical protein
MVVRVEGGRAKVMTWNIWWRFGPRWREREAALIETLRRLWRPPDALVEHDRLMRRHCRVCRLEAANRC